MNAETDARQRERAENAYRDLFSRIRETPGINLDDAFNKPGPVGGRSLNELFADAGYTLEQRTAVMNSLAHAKRCAEGIDSGELYKADRNADRFRASINELRADGLLSERQLRSMEGDAKVWDSQIEEKRPEAFLKAQKFFAETVTNGGTDPESIKTNSDKFYDLLRDAGLDHERAGLGYHALQDAMSARMIQRTMQSNTAASQPLLELSNAIKLIEKGSPPILDAANMNTMRDLEKMLEKREKFTDNPAQDGIPHINATGAPGVDFRVPDDIDKQAADRLEKLQAMMDWLNKRPNSQTNEIHSLGGFYSHFFDNAPGALKQLKSALEGNSPGDPAVNQYEAVQRADKLLNSLHPNHRNMSPQDIVKHIDELQKSGIRNLNAVADAIGEIPRVGPAARGVLKSGGVGLQYARGDISGAEAATSVLKEAVSSTVDTFAGKMKFAGPMREAVWHFTTAVGNELQAEIGKAFTALQKNPDADKGQLLKEAFAKALIKGFTETFGKQGEKLLEAVPYKRYGSELLEFATGLAKKFGIERQVEDVLDNLKSLTDKKQSANPSLIDKIDSQLAAIENPNMPFSTEQRRNLIAAIAVTADRDGLKQIDGLMLNSDRSRVIAVEGDTNASNNKTSSVNLRDALAQPASQNLETLASQKIASSETQTKDIEPAKKTIVSV